MSHHDLHVDQLISSIDNELSNLSLWFKVNKLSSNYMLFKNCHSNRIYDNTHIFIDGTELTKVSHAKFLGVLIDESLAWEKHNSYVTNIVSKYSGILFSFKAIAPT